jgi:PadR family transcriptional regulator PadR
MADRSQLLRGVIDLVLLSIVAAGPSYGYDIVERLRAAGIADLNEATVYSALRRLETAGALSSKLVASASGPARRYYELTARGARERADALATWRDVARVVDSVASPARRGRRAS